MALGHKTGGRRAGTPNKVTKDARETIGRILDTNIHRLSEWLESVAYGVKESKFSDDGIEYEYYVVKPNPSKAFDMLQSLLEFHVPKLTRIQVSENTSSESRDENNLEVFDKLLSAIKLQRQSSG
jgi:hypothetical protein